MSAINRRSMITGMAVAAAAQTSPSVASQPSASQQAPQWPAHEGGGDMLPPKYLHVIAILIRDTGDALPDLIDWYENVHSREAAYQWPFETRYARNYITTVEEGPKPPYRVVLELGYKSEEAKDRLRALMKSGLAQPKNGSMAQQMQKWAFARFNYTVMFPVEPVEIKAAPPPSDPNAPLPRRVILLRRSGSASQSDFEVAVKKQADAIARLASNVGVSVNFRRDVPPYKDAPDAVVFVDNAQSAKLPRPEKFAEIMNVFTVEMRKSPVEMAAP